MNEWHVFFHFQQINQSIKQQQKEINKKQSKHL